jgi:Zn ribbon nucleic-acid-binding protein
MVTMMQTMHPPRLTAIDRCDSCGAQAYVQVWLAPDGAELLFCAHHAHQYESKLRDVAIAIHDETGLLTGS